jgi:hypothetical protein
MRMPANYNTYICYRDLESVDCVTSVKSNQVSSLPSPPYLCIPDDISLPIMHSVHYSVNTSRMEALSRCDDLSTAVVLGFRTHKMFERYVKVC